MEHTTTEQYLDESLWISIPGTGHRCRCSPSLGPLPGPLFGRVSGRSSHPRPPATLRSLLADGGGQQLHPRVQAVLAICVMKGDPVNCLFVSI